MKKTLVNHVYIRIWSKFENDWNFSILFHSTKNTCKSCLHLNLIILTDFQGFSVNEEKLQNWSIFKFSPKVRVYNSGQNLIMTNTS